MIKRIYEIDGISISDDYYCGKIRAYMEAYGGREKFCSFYTERGSLASGNILMLGANIVVSKGFADKAELSEFLMMYAPESIECPQSVSEKIKLQGYEKHHRTLFRLSVPQPKNIMSAEKNAPPVIDPGDMAADGDVSLDSMFMILNQCFNGLSYDGWYADMSHRVRHGISHVYSYRESACASIDFCGMQSAYISSVAVAPAMRNQGYGRTMMNFLAYELKKKHLQGYLWADDESAGFYKKLGYMPVDEDHILFRTKR